VQPDKHVKTAHAVCGAWRRRHRGNNMLAGSDTQPSPPRGADVIKCLAVGASAVLMGRPVLWVAPSGGTQPALPQQSSSAPTFMVPPSSFSSTPCSCSSAFMVSRPPLCPLRRCTAGQGGVRGQESGKPALQVWIHTLRSSTYTPHTCNNTQAARKPRAARLHACGCGPHHVGPKACMPHPPPCPPHPRWLCG
jgi:hypothetical protein